MNAKGMPSIEPFSSKVERISSGDRTSTQSPRFNFDRFSFTDLSRYSAERAAVFAPSRAPDPVFPSPRASSKRRRISTASLCT